MKVVGIEMAVRDRPSFDTWWPQHLSEILELVDELYIRVDPATYHDVVNVLTAFALERDEQIAAGGRTERWTTDRITLEKQHEAYGRWQEDAERDALLDWALARDADWAVCFDADEVIEPGGGNALRQLLAHPVANTFRMIGVDLTYSSHHRPGYVLPYAGISPWRAFKIDTHARSYRYRADRDGLHCGSVPAPGLGAVKVPELRVVHYHATSAAEFMAERAFYDNTREVERWGGIDWLYRCDRFGNEADAVPLEEALAGADQRLGRIAAGEGLIRL